MHIKNTFIVNLYFNNFRKRNIRVIFVTNNVWLMSNNLHIKSLCLI